MSRLLRLDPNFKPAFQGVALAEDLTKKLISSCTLSSLSIVDVFLFGSAAEGKNTIDSDLDILVIVPDNYDQRIKDFYKIVAQPFFSPVAIDWIFKTKAEFDVQKEIGGISRIAFLNGIRIKINEFK